MVFIKGGRKGKFPERSLAKFMQGLVVIYSDLALVDYPRELTILKQENNACDEYLKEFMRLSHHVHEL